MHYHRFAGALACALSIAASVAFAQTIPSDYAAYLYKATPNPTGIATGFWVNYSMHDDAIARFGFRTADRVGFTKWRQVETVSGTYDWTNAFTRYKQSKRSGANTIAAVNIAHSLAVNPKGMDAIPSFYTQRITDPVTRAKGKAFLRAFVQRMLSEIGAFTLLIDYEMMWFYDTTIPANRTEYRDWYLEAVATAKKAASDVGKADQLKIALCVSGRVNDRADLLLGGGNPPNHTAQIWLLDCMAVSDILAMDLYHFDPDFPTSAAFMLETIRFWRDNYSGGKPLWITEVGYSTVKDARPGYTPPAWDRIKGHGTEAQQSEYFQDFFAKLAADSGLNERVKTICIWSFMDERPYGDTASDLGHYFGMARKGYAGDSNGMKPAAATVANIFANWEASAALRPSNHAFVSTVTSQMKNASTITSLAYTDGQTHQYLKGVFTLPASSSGERFIITSDLPCNPVLTLNGNTLATASSAGATSHSLNIASAVRRGGQKNYYLLRLPTTKLPATIGIKTAYPVY